MQHNLGGRKGHRQREINRKCEGRHIKGGKRPKHNVQPQVYSPATPPTPHTQPVHPYKTDHSYVAGFMGTFEWYGALSTKLKRIGTIYIPDDNPPNSLQGIDILIVQATENEGEFKCLAALMVYQPDREKQRIPLILNHAKQQDISPIMPFLRKELGDETFTYAHANELGKRVQSFYEQKKTGHYQ